MTTCIWVKKGSGHHFLPDGKNSLAEQYWLIVSGILRHPQKGNGGANVHNSNHYNAIEIGHLKSNLHTAGLNDIRLKKKQGNLTTIIIRC